MLKDYYENKFRDDLSRISYVKPNKNSFTYSWGLTRNMEFIDVSSINLIEVQHRQDFIFLLFILMTLDQVCHTYFGGSRFRMPLYGDFGMGQAAHVRSPRDFIIKSINIGLISYKVKQVKIDSYSDFMINATHKLLNESDINKNIHQFYLYLFADKDMASLTINNNEKNIGSNVFNRFMSTLLNKLK
jgi:hypothetical protein